MRADGSYTQLKAGEVMLTALVKPDGQAIAWDDTLTNYFCFNSDQYIDHGPVKAQIQEIIKEVPIEIIKEIPIKSSNSSIRDLIGQDMTSINIQFRGEK
jgi:hypothetical protein